MKYPKPRFSGHQTFPFRYGWLEKGYRFATQGRKFSDEDAIVALGVGKNMVESIRYWSEVAGILTPDCSPTNFADRLLDETKGWDPYLEDNASLWLVHWKLINNPNYMTTGSLLFSSLHKPEFNKRDIMEVIVKQLTKQEIKLPSENVIARDVDVYLRAYAGIKRFERMKNPEESFDCPLQELGLLNAMNDAELYRFNIGSKQTLPPEVVGYALWDYITQTASRSSVRIQEALYHEGSPGQAFMLDENSMIEAINLLNNEPQWASKISFTESAGIALIHCSINNGAEFLEHYYTKGQY